MKLEWKPNGYGDGVTAKIGFFEISVCKSSHRRDVDKPYKVRVYSLTLKKKYATREEAKEAGVKRARQWVILLAQDLGIIKPVRKKA